MICLLLRDITFIFVSFIFKALYLKDVALLEYEQNRAPAKEYLHEKGIQQLRQLPSPRQCMQGMQSRQPRMACPPTYLPSASHGKCSICLCSGYCALWLSFLSFAFFFRLYHLAYTILLIIGELHIILENINPLLIILDHIDL